MQQKIPGIRYEIGLYSKRIGVFRGLSATNKQSSHKNILPLTMVVHLGLQSFIEDAGG